MKPSDSAAQRCPWCSQPVEQPPTGRRRVYCRDAHRRLAEAAIARLGTEAGRLERKVSETLLADSLGFDPPATFARKQRKAADRIEARIAALEAEMARLMGSQAEGE